MSKAKTEKIKSPHCGSESIAFTKDRRYFFKVVEVPSDGEPDPEPDWLSAIVVPQHVTEENSYHTLHYQVICQGCNEVLAESAV